MANIRAEILAAGRSRKGWLDSRSQSLDQPFFRSIKSNFEEKVQDKDKTTVKMKGEGLRPMGTKVSTIANMFQSLSQQKTDNPVPKSPSNKESPNYDPAVSEKYPNILHSPVSSQSSTCSLSRRGSHLARFNNAKAMFEKLEGQSRLKSSSGEIRKVSSASSVTNCRLDSSRNDKNLNSNKVVSSYKVPKTVVSSRAHEQTSSGGKSFIPESCLIGASSMSSIPSENDVQEHKHFTNQNASVSTENCEDFVSDHRNFYHKSSSFASTREFESKADLCEENLLVDHSNLDHSHFDFPENKEENDLVGKKSGLSLIDIKSSKDMCNLKKVAQHNESHKINSGDSKPNDIKQDILVEKKCNAHLYKQEFYKQNITNNLLNIPKRDEIHSTTDIGKLDIFSNALNEVSYKKAVHPSGKEVTVVSSESHSNHQHSSDSDLGRYELVESDSHFELEEVSQSSITQGDVLSKIVCSQKPTLDLEDCVPAVCTVVSHDLNQTFPIDPETLYSNNRHPQNHILITETCEGIESNSPCVEVGSTGQESAAFVEENFSSGAQTKVEISAEYSFSVTFPVPKFPAESEPKSDGSKESISGDHGSTRSESMSSASPLESEQTDIPLGKCNSCEDLPTSVCTDDSGYKGSSTNPPSSVDSDRKETVENIKHSLGDHANESSVLDSRNFTQHDDMESPPLPDPPSPYYLIKTSQESEALNDTYSLTSSPKQTRIPYIANRSFFPKFASGIHSRNSPENQDNLYHSAGESLAECPERDLEFLENSLEGDDSDVSNVSPCKEELDLEYVEVMTQDEEDKLLSTSRQSLLSDEEAREVALLLSETDEKYESGVTRDETYNVPENSLIHNGLEYHLLNDGHYYFECPGLEPWEDDEVCEEAFWTKNCRVKFSTKPIKVYSTYSTEDYDRRNEEVDPISASAEYELEKRIEKMDVFPVELIKGPEGLGLSIIGMGVGADAGVEKLGIFVKTVTESGAADRDGRIKVNDQIIEVDGKSLVGVTQSYAATVLRNTSGHVRFLIGREKDGVTSEIAQLINQSLMADKEREAERQALDQQYSGKSLWQRCSSVESPASTPEDSSYANVSCGDESISPDVDVESLKSKLKKAHYRNAVTDSELRKLREKLQAVERMEHDYAKLLDLAQCQLDELSHNLRGAEQELLQNRQELESMKAQYAQLDKKYAKAKKYIKEFRKREQEFIQQEEYHLQQLQEKDQEYNALVKALKDRIILLEQTLNDTQRKAGLPLELPYSTPLKQLTPLLRRLPAERPKFLQVSSLEMSDSEASDGELPFPFSPDDTDEDSNKRATVERKPIREELFDKAVPHTELLDTSAAKAKAELANKGSLANRQPPSSKKSTGSSSADEATPEKNFTYDIFIRPSEEFALLAQGYSNSSISPPSLNSSYSSVNVGFYDFQWESSVDQQTVLGTSPPLTLLEEMKVAVAARQARINRSAISDDLLENEDGSFPSTEKNAPVSSDIVSQSSFDSSGQETSFSYSMSSITESHSMTSVTESSMTSVYESHSVTSASEVPQATSFSDKPPTPDNSSPPVPDETILQPVVQRTESSTNINVEKRYSNQFLFTPVHEWTSEQVGLWLRSLGYDHHVPQFLDSDITGQILLQIDSARLKALGVLSSTERNAIKKKVKEMRAQLEKERRTQEKEQKAREKQRKKAAAALKK